MEPLALARPTPTHPLRRLSAAVGAEIWVKRDDLTGFGLSGNKVRKLEWLLADALARGCERVVTCGGLQSNHCRATAVAARQLGLQPVLLLRGAPSSVPDGNLLLDQLMGAELHYCSTEDYRLRRDDLMAALADARTYVIPEGGSNALGALAYSRVWDEVREPFDVVVCAVGSGGTVAGLAHGAPDGTEVVGVAVCDDAAFFTPRVEAIASEIAREGSLRRWRILDGFQGPAYGVAPPEVWSTIRAVARLEGAVLDPVYTGKAMHGLLTEVGAGRIRGRILFWHTGGGFGLFGRGAELMGS